MFIACFGFEMCALSICYMKWFVVASIDRPSFITNRETMNDERWLQWWLFSTLSGFRWFHRHRDTVNGKARSVFNERVFNRMILCAVYSISHSFGFQFATQFLSFRKGIKYMRNVDCVNHRNISFNICTCHMPHAVHNIQRANSEFGCLDIKYTFGAFYLLYCDSN